MVTNIHHRHYPGHSEEELGALLDTLGQPDDRLWPTAMGNFPPMRLDGPLGGHPRGGHGLVRYHTTHYTPGHSVTWRFEDSVGLDGFHRAEVVPASNGSGPALRHVLRGQPRGSMRLLWPLIVRWLHDACVEELFDQAQASLDGTDPVPRRHGLWARFLLRVLPSAEKEEQMLAKQAAA